MISDAVSAKPYLLRAIYEWCVDQGSTPHVAVLVDENVLIPPGYERNGQIVLNIGPEATHQLAMGNEAITFQARFGGVVHSIYIPVGHVCAIYAVQSGQGMVFEPDLQAATNGQKSGKAPLDSAQRTETGHSARVSPVLHCTESADSKTIDGGNGDHDDPPPTGGGHKTRTRLTIVK